MTTRVFQPISPARWQDVKTTFQTQAGAALNGDSGNVTSHGVNFSYVYKSDAQFLTVTVEHVPWVYMMSESDVLDKFQSWVDGVQ